MDRVAAQADAKLADVKTHDQKSDESQIRMPVQLPGQSVAEPTKKPLIQELDKNEK